MKMKKRNEKNEREKNHRTCIPFAKGKKYHSSKISPEKYFTRMKKWTIENDKCLGFVHRIPATKRNARNSMIILSRYIFRSQRTHVCMPTQAHWGSKRRKNQKKKKLKKKENEAKQIRTCFYHLYVITHSIFEATPGRHIHTVCKRTSEKQVNKEWDRGRGWTERREYAHPNTLPINNAAIIFFIGIGFNVRFFRLCSLCCCYSSDAKHFSFNSFPLLRENKKLKKAKRTRMQTTRRAESESKECEHPVVEAAVISNQHGR